MASFLVPRLWGSLVLIAAASAGCFESEDKGQSDASSSNGDAAVADAASDADAATDNADAATDDAGLSEADGGGCGGEFEYNVYTAVGSAPTGFFSEEGKAFFFADPADGGGFRLYSYDGSALTVCGSTGHVEGDVLATGRFQGSVVVLTSTGIYERTGPCTLELLKAFDAEFEPTCCLYSDPNFLIEFDGRLFFQGAATKGDLELWAYSVEDDELEIFDRIPGKVESAPFQAHVFADQLWFIARDSDGFSRALFRYDGAAFAKFLDNVSAVAVGVDKLYATSNSNIVEVSDTLETSSTAVPFPHSPLAVIGDSVFVVGGTFSDLYEVKAGAATMVADLGCGAGASVLLGLEDSVYWFCPSKSNLDLSDFGVYALENEMTQVLEFPSDMRIRSGLTPWNGGLLFAGDDGTYERSQKPFDFKGHGLEPWNWSFAEEAASLLEDLNPLVHFECELD